MGGISESGFQVDRTAGENGGPVGVFKGNMTRVPWLALSHCSAVKRALSEKARKMLFFKQPSGTEDTACAGFWLGFDARQN